MVGAVVTVVGIVVEGTCTLVRRLRRAKYTDAIKPTDTNNTKMPASRSAVFGFFPPVDTGLTTFLFLQGYFFFLGLAPGKEDVLLRPYLQATVHFPKNGDVDHRFPQATEEISHQDQGQDH